MTPERWRRVSHLYDAVVERPAEERRPFLAAACAGDIVLVREVESLLAQDDQPSPLDGPVWAPGELSSHEPANLGPGTRLGPYEIQFLLGSGGMGDVYQAIDSRLERPVAVKVLKAELAADQGFRTRFEREARTISRLDHPNICTLYDVGEADSTAFLVMQCLDGVPLSDTIRRQKLSFPEVVDIGTSLASALTYAHGRGILHRDIKPHNLIRQPDGCVKLLDFGIAKAMNAWQDDSSATTALPTAQGIPGTLEYMSPEQLSGYELDGRSDMFSLGLVLYELYTGRHPFRGQTHALTASAILEANYPGLSDSTGSTEFDRVLRKMLAKTPAERYPTMADCLADLQSVRRAAPPSPELPSTAWSKIRPRLGVVAAAAAALILALLVLWPRSGPVETTAPAVGAVTPGPAVGTPTQVSYWLDVSPPADAEATDTAFQSLGDEVYRNGWRFRLNLLSPAPGHLYLVADEPPTADETGLAVLFPQSGAGEPTVARNEVTTGWFVLTGPAAREALWLVWSPTPVEELARLSPLVNPQDRGLIQDAATANGVRALLTGEVARATDLSLDRSSMRARLESPESMIVHRLELQHD